MAKPIISLISTLLFLISFFDVSAAKVRAYVVTNKSDTILGEINLGVMNKTTGAIYLMGFDSNALHYEVWFRPQGSKRFKRYTAVDFRLFSFRYNNNTFEYRRFTLNSKSISTGGRQKDRFLMLVHSSKLRLYKDVIQEPFRRSTTNMVEPVYYFHIYYLYSAKHGLVKVESNDEIHSVIDLLKKFELEDGFVSSLSEGLSFNDIASILNFYAKWCREIKT